MTARGLMVGVAALAMVNAASAQSGTPAGRSIFDTPRFTIFLPPGFGEIRRYDKDQPLFYFSDSETDPHSRRALTVMFFEGKEFAGGNQGVMLQTTALGLSRQHTSFQISKPYYLDASNKELCSKWSGDAGGTTFTGIACEIKTPAGFVLLHGMDAAASFPATETAFTAAMLSFRLKS
jgi:hypothetical protein